MAGHCHLPVFTRGHRHDRAPLHHPTSRGASTPQQWQHQCRRRQVLVVWGDALAEDETRALELGVTAGVAVGAGLGVAVGQDVGGAEVARPPRPPNPRPLKVCDISLLI